MPRGKRMVKEIDATDIKVGQPADIILQDGSVAVGNTCIEPVTSDVLHKQYMDELAFMEEMIEIIVHDATDPNAENPVQIGNNGIFVQIFRNQPTKLKRKFVDTMIVKNTAVRTPEYTNGAGERAFKIEQRSALKFPFSITKDPNPRGGEWLRRRMAEVI